MTDADDELFQEFHRTGKRNLRNLLVERHMGLAAHIARRFSPAGARDDDVRQVAMLGLVKAVDRFDPNHGSAFSAFAGRTIEGEIKRHFRDRTWAVRVPRGAKELHLAVRRADDELTQQLGRSPNVTEVADHLGIDRDDVITGLSAGAARSVGSIDAGMDNDDAPAPDRAGMLAEHDTGFVFMEDRQVVTDLLSRLPARERRIVELRFFEEMSQSEIAHEVGISQMHVSRLLRRSFEQMREWLVASSADDPGAS
jgi:RNA polymerase sigma-B factor